MFVIKRSIRKISPTIEKLVPLSVHLSLDSATTLKKK